METCTRPAPCSAQTRASVAGAAPFTAAAVASSVSAASTAVYAAALSTTSGRASMTAFSTAAGSVTSSSARVRPTTSWPPASPEQVGAQLAAGAGDQQPHPRALSGSHQARLSRYHRTVSASPSSNAYRGR